MNDYSQIEAAVSTLDEMRALALVEETLAAGNNPQDVIRAVQEGLRLVGRRYEDKEIYLAGLIMAGEIFRGAMELARPGMENEPVGDPCGRVLLGTVQGDIHDIGKNMAALAFRMFGFVVDDLGVNVPPARFLEAAQQHAPDVIGMSGLLVVAFDSMQETVTLLRENASQLTRNPLLVIGGGTIDEQVSRYVGADLWSDDAMKGARQCQAALQERGAGAA